MPRDINKKKNCHDCSAKPGELHQLGCDTERCRMCGGQAISCDCIYKVCGMNPKMLEVTHPDIYQNGPTDEMVEQFHKELDKIGGRISWTGIWPGVLECQEFGWYAKMIPGMMGWHACKPDDPDGTEDLNRLYKDAVWSPEQGRYILPEKETNVRPIKTVAAIVSNCPAITQ